MTGVQTCALPISFVITKRLCLSLQRADRESVLHGRESGRLMMLPHGEFVEVHDELTPEEKWTLTQHEQLTPLALPESDANGVRNPQGFIRRKIRARLTKAGTEQIAKPTASEMLEIGDGHH